MVFIQNFTISLATHIFICSYFLEKFFSDILTGSQCLSVTRSSIKSSDVKPWLSCVIGDTVVSVLSNAVLVDLCSNPGAGDGGLFELSLLFVDGCWEMEDGCSGLGPSVM